jgi:hypothetical protein
MFGFCDDLGLKGSLELMLEQKTRQKMFEYCPNVPLHLFKDSYCQPYGKNGRSSEANLNVPRPPTEKSSKPGGFNTINFCYIDVNQPNSPMALVRWNLDPNFVEAKLLILFDNDVDKMNTFIAAESRALQKLRNLFYDIFIDKKRLDEPRDFQPLFQLFVFGLYQHFRESISSLPQRTVAPANNCRLTVELNSKDFNETNETWCDSGSPDVFILNGELDAAIDLTSPVIVPGLDVVDMGVPGNVEVVIELKSPYGALYHSAMRAALDQMTCEVEGLAQTTSSPSCPAPSVVKGALTDLISISLHARVIKHDKIFHCASHRIVNVEDYIKHLLFISYCPIAVEDLESSITGSPVYIEIADEEEDQNDCDKKPSGNQSGSDGEHNGGDDGDRQPDMTKKGRCNLRSSRQGGRQHKFAKRSRFADEEEEERDLENIQYLLHYDAMIRGFNTLRESDFDQGRLIL